jgi:hypothetical protein
MALFTTINRQAKAPLNKGAIDSESTSALQIDTDKFSTLRSVTVFSTGELA